MDLKEIRQLLKLMDQHDVTEFRLEREDGKITLKRGQEAEGVPMVPQGAPMAMPAAPQAPAAPAAAPAESAAPVEEGVENIESPMVGTFYAAPDPDSEPFVTVGADVADDSVVCIIEAMKIMNEIKADVSGKIVEVCVQNGQTVEFGQTLFKVKTA